MTEQSGPRELVRYAVAAEEVGFDFEVSSDHFSPWLTEQGHAPNAWTTLGAVAQATQRVGLMTYVTCPTMRYHPAVVAQQAATLQILAEGRFTLGLGSGENLNEHVVGRGWPAIAERQDMLAEAIEVIRALHTGDLVDHRGEFFQVDSARIWDLPGRGRRHRRRRRRRPRHRALRSPGRPPRRGRAEGRDHRVVERRRGRAADRRQTPAPSARSRSAGTPTRTPPSRAPTSSSAGSAAAGRSTPTCPTPGRLQRRDGVRPARGRRRVDPVRPRPGQDRRGGLGLLGGRLHRRRARAGRRRGPGPLPGRGGRTAAGEAAGGSAVSDAVLLRHRRHPGRLDLPPRARLAPGLLADARHRHRRCRASTAPSGWAATGSSPTSPDRTSRTPAATTCARLA